MHSSLDEKGGHSTAAAAATTTSSSADNDSCSIRSVRTTRSGRSISRHSHALVPQAVMPAASLVDLALGASEVIAHMQVPATTSGAASSSTVDSQASGFSMMHTLQVSSTTTRSEKTASLRRVGSIATAAGNDYDDGFVEGGVQGWLVVLASFMIHSFVFITEYSFGVFEHHYHDVFIGANAFSIAFVGTMGSAATYLCGFFAGVIADRIGYRITCATGTIVMTVSLILASFCRQLWQLYLTQGILFGVGASLAYYPAISVVSHYFVARRGIATGLAVSGVGLGGLILAPLTQFLIERVGTFNTLRVLAAMIFVFCGPASFMIVERKRPALASLALTTSPTSDMPSSTTARLENTKTQSVTSFTQSSTERQKNKDKAAMTTPSSIHSTGSKKRGSGPDQSGHHHDDVVPHTYFDAPTANSRNPPFLAAIRIFKNPQFLCLALSEFTSSIGFLIPLYFMQTYSTFIGLTPSQGALLLGLSNMASCLGRISLGFAADHVSNGKVLLLCVWGTAFSVMVLWTLAKNFTVLLLMALSFGFLGGGFISTLPVVLADTFGTEQIASIIGLLYCSGGLGMLGGTPLAGWLLEMTKPNISYLPSIMTAGASLTASAICVTGWAFFKARDERRALRLGQQEGC
ncbi:hypothetical protein DFQ27_009520 [Actinomortierella ambigua]|uniref:Major facilitator superfamily (MFS) profile domain-containing protein n=1 Tax=Actinomortierella ambigua TaxID=1343610 RepID=A0A9P6TXG6_9FUNG|nr:hypothetical protein DFQ27_009520 [Actinomortierella ambigua]